jgi:multiphosphoryl transfer protein
MLAQSQIQLQTEVRLLAPMSGYLMAIGQVPDPVFAQKMVGDGIAIDPTSQMLTAPCDGEVILIHAAHHALTLKTPQGLEILMHIGLDTVGLQGQGFTVHVKVGDRVKTGDRLIAFDADSIALKATSLLTMIVITNGDRVANLASRSGPVTVGQDIILEVTLKADAATPQVAQSGELITSAPIVVPNPIGLHARPAAVLVNLAKPYQSIIQLHRGSHSANTKSVVALINLDVKHNDQVTLTAVGADAQAAISVLTQAMVDGLGEARSLPGVSDEGTAPTLPPQPPSDPNLILGVAASPGLVVGQTYRVQEIDLNVIELAQNPEAEKETLERAIAQALADVTAVRGRVKARGGASKAEIFAAHEALLDDPELLDLAHGAIDQGKSAAYAWQQAFTTQADQLAQLPNPLLAERATDLRDIGQRVLRLLAGVDTQAVEYPPNTILLAADLTPSDLTNLDRSQVKGFCTMAGSATSHVAILARSMGLPAIAGVESRILEIADGMPAILDGSLGQLRLNVSPAEVDRVQAQIVRQQAKQASDLESAAQPAITLDQQRIEVVANISNVQDAEKSVALGGEGVGLLRSEFMFMDRAAAPSEAEQTSLYRNILAVLGSDRPLVIRTLDVGGDKPLAYLPLPHEANPFLGERGIRIGLDQPDLLRTQLRAILRSASAGKLRVMFPMVGRLEEIRQAKAILEAERQQLGIEPIAVGIMVEIPAAAILAEQFAQEVDFFSIGTNDLTQYTLAIDRGHPKLAPLADGLNPAVLRLIAQTVKGATQYGKWVGICGGIASDPQAVPILIGLGIRELSVSIPAIPSIKAQIRTLTLSDCQTLAAKALTMATAAEVRALCPVLDP